MLCAEIPKCGELFLALRCASIASPHQGRRCRSSCRLLRFIRKTGLNTREPVTNRAVGYTDNDKLQEVRDGLALHPAGGYLSTALDLAKWDAVLYTDDILSDATRRQMWTPVTLNDGTSYPYGFGWELGTLRGHRQVHHGGETSGFLSEFARFVDDRLTVVVLMNLDDADVESLANGVAAFYLPRLVLN